MIITTNNANVKKVSSTPHMKFFVILKKEKKKKKEKKVYHAPSTAIAHGALPKKNPSLAIFVREKGGRRSLSEAGNGRKPIG